MYRQHGVYRATFFAIGDEQDRDHQHERDCQFTDEWTRVAIHAGWRPRRRDLVRRARRHEHPRRRPPETFTGCRLPRFSVVGERVDTDQRILIKGLSRRLRTDGTRSIDPEEAKFRYQGRTMRELDERGDERSHG